MTSKAEQILAGLGGSGNIVDIEACITRLRTEVTDAGLVDEAIVYIAPTLLGAGRSVLDGGAVGTLPDAHRAELRDVVRLGPDVRLRYALT